MASLRPPRNRALIDPQALMAIQSLELRARTVVEGFWHGLHRSPYHGFSVEFTEYRQYTPGDDTRYIDWRLFARSDRFYIKKFEDETNLRCYIVLDHSQSMAYGSLPYSKAQYASTLAATLAYFLFQQGDAVGLMTFDEVVREYLPPRNRQTHLRHLLLALEKPAAGRATDLESPLKQTLELARKRGLIMLISDLLAPIERFQKTLSAAKAYGHEIVVFQTLDPAELEFNFSDPMMYEDVESGRRLYIDPGTARKDYLRRFRAHLASIEQCCRKLGIGYSQVATNQPLDLALLQFMEKRQ